MSKLLRRSRKFIAGGFAESVDSKCKIYNRFARDKYKKESRIFVKFLYFTNMRPLAYIFMRVFLIT